MMKIKKDDLLKRKQYEHFKKLVRNLRLGNYEKDDNRKSNNNIPEGIESQKD